MNIKRKWKEYLKSKEKKVIGILEQEKIDALVEIKTQEKILQKSLNMFMENMNEKLRELKNAESELWEDIKEMYELPSEISLSVNHETGELTELE